MNGAADHEQTIPIEAQFNGLADVLFSRIEFHGRLIDINVMSDSIVVGDSHDRAGRDGQTIWAELSTVLADRDGIRRENARRKRGRGHRGG